MSVLIKGLKMPKGDEALVVCINSNGTVDEPNWQWDYTLIRGAEAVELPDHGDLIDREYALGSACSGIIRTLPTTEAGEDWIRVEEVRQSLKSVPAVIPAERSKE